MVDVISGLHGIDFAMDEEDLAQTLDPGFHPTQQVVPIGVPAESFDPPDISRDPELVAEDAHIRHAVQNLAAQRVGRLLGQRPGSEQAARDERPDKQFFHDKPFRMLIEKNQTDIIR